MKRTPFDASKAMEQEIEPLVKELIALCKAHDVPLLCMVTTKITETPCDCGDNADYAVEATYILQGRSFKMAPLQQAMVTLEDFPADVQAQFVEAIMKTREVIALGGTVKVKRAVNLI